MKIDAPFMDCPERNCVNGWIYHCDRENASTWSEECRTCDGTGRIYFHEEPGLVARIRAWWETLPLRRRLNYIAVGCFLGSLAIVIFLMWLAGAAE